MPPLEVVKTPGYLAQLTAAPPPQHTWEVGASCNFLIAAVRLGMRVGAVANLGDDAYGAFLRDVLRVRACQEGMRLVFSIPAQECVSPCMLHGQQQGAAVEGDCCHEDHGCETNGLMLHVAPAPLLPLSCMG